MKLSCSNLSVFMDTLTEQRKLKAYLHRKSLKNSHAMTAVRHILCECLGVVSFEVLLATNAKFQEHVRIFHSEAYCQTGLSGQDRCFNHMKIKGPIICTGRNFRYLILLYIHPSIRYNSLSNNCHPSLFTILFVALPACYRRALKSFVMR